MATDGKPLESLVAFIEGLLLPQGFEVKTNVRSFDDDGIQIDELDVVIHGQRDEQAFSWLIECRDRPAGGAASRPWLEQLVGRKTIGKFDTVTAVSTTGFSSGARLAARAGGIELREVHSLQPSEFASWLNLSEMQVIWKFQDLHHVNLVFHHNEPEERIEAGTCALGRDFGEVDGDDKSRILFFQTENIRFNLTEAFVRTLAEAPECYEGVSPEMPKLVHTSWDGFEHDNELMVDTPIGCIRIKRLDFYGALRIVETDVPIANAVEYRHFDSNKVISQTAAFQPQHMLGTSWEVELHRVTEPGQTYITLRRKDEKAAPKKRAKHK